VLVGEEVHVTLLRALRYLGFGHDRVTRVGVNANGAIDLVALEVLNEVVLNQVLVASTPEHLARIQADGTCWLGGTTCRGRHALRVSFSNWSTTENDVRRAATAILDPR